MPILFLGTAQDGGVPQAGCRCDNCRSFRRMTASLALIDGNKAVLIDITPDFNMQYRLLVERFNVEISAIYLTHAHWGHYGGLPLLGKEGWNTHGMPVYLSQKFLVFLNAHEPFAALIRAGNIVPHVIDEHSLTPHGITPFSVEHRHEYSETFAFLFQMNDKSVLYMPDADDFIHKPDSLIRSVDLAILDGTFWSADEVSQRDIAQVPHPRVKDTCEKYRDMADRIIFTHLNHTNPLLNPDSLERRKVEAMGFRVAEDGGSLDFG